MFNTQKFTLLAYSGRTSIYEYITDDALEAVKKFDYFPVSEKNLKDGDHIYVTASDGKVLIEYDYNIKEGNQHCAVFI